MARPLLLGHRGARAHPDAPENTFAAFDLALQAGCDGFEFDVRLTADGVAAVVHDPVVNEVEVASSGFEYLKAATRDSVPTLDEVFSRYSQRAFLDIELKVTGLERIAVDLVRDFASARGVLVSSFLPEVLETVSRIDPSVPLGYICRDPALLLRWKSLPLTHLVLEHPLVSESLLAEVHGQGKRLFVWTVNDDVGMRRFHSLGADGIISDIPRRLHDALSALD